MFSGSPLFLGKPAQLDDLLIRPRSSINDKQRMLILITSNHQLHPLTVSIVNGYKAECLLLYTIFRPRGHPNFQNG